MPRATRKALAEDAPSRSSPRASTRASTAAAASPSPAKTRGRQGKAEAEAVETKTRGRSSSRAKAAAAVVPPPPPPAAASRQSRSRSRGAAAASKTPPTPPKRGRGKAKKEPEEEEEEEEEVEEEEEEEEEEEVTPKRSRAQKKTKSPPAAKKATPPARASRGSRRSAEAAAQEEEVEVAKKTTPRRGKGRSTPTTTPPSRSRRGRGAGEPEEEQREDEAEEGKADGSAEAKKEEEGDSKMKGETAAAAASEGKPEVEVLTEKKKGPETEAEPEKMEDTAAEDQTEPAALVEEKKESPESASKMDTEEAAEKETKAQAEEVKIDVQPEEKRDVQIENAAEEPKEAKEEPVSERDAAPEVAVSAREKSEVENAETAAPAQETAEEAQAPEHKEDKREEEAAPVSNEPMEEDAPKPPAPQPTSQAKNGEVEDAQPPRKPAAKRKLEEEDVEEIVDESHPKRARINGTDTDSVASQSAPDTVVTDPKPAAGEEEDEKNLLKDYEVINKEELPLPDSAEVAAAVPKPVEDTSPVAADKEEKMEEEKIEEEEKMEEEDEKVEEEEKVDEEEKMEEEEKVEQGGSGEPVTVAPLTEAELAKAYGSEVQGIERGETDDVSSTIVEVGSVGGSDISGIASRGLDVSEMQSASNSVDGDDAADSSMNESSAVPEASTDFVSPAPLQQTCDQTTSEVSPPTAASPVVDSVPSVADVPQTDLPSVTNGSSADLHSDQLPTSTDLHQNDDASSQQATSSLPNSTETNAAPLQNSHPNPPPSKGSGSVSDNLGTPDPAFLAAYSSPGLLNRAYVANPAVPVDSIVPENKFSVVSYNILAECHRRNSKYKAAEEFLVQGYRHDLMMQELKYLNGDIVCMQEVDPDYFNNTLLPAMQTLGYEGLMKRRTQEYFHEGEATFYKSGVFELDSSRGVSLTESAQKEVETGGLSAEVAAAVNKYLDRADVVLITRLRCKATGKFVTVGNIHVVWDYMKSTDVQCIQAACAIKEVVGMSGSEGAHIVCGDFNAEWSSPVYQLVLDGYLSDSSIHTLQAVQRLELNDGAKSLVNHLWRAFQHTSSNMKSAYSTITKSEPEVTSYSSQMKTVDYIFYSASCLVPLGVLKTIDAPVINATEGLPTKDFPSDHLALKSVMAFCK